TSGSSLPLVPAPAAPAARTTTAPQLQRTDRRLLGQDIEARWAQLPPPVEHDGLPCLLGFDVEGDWVAPVALVAGVKSAATLTSEWCPGKESPPFGLSDCNCDEIVLHFPTLGVPRHLLFLKYADAPR